MRERYFIGKIGITITNIEDTIQFIADSINKGRYGYICVTNSRTAYKANIDNKYCSIQNNSLLTLPDGSPLVWIAHNKGYKKVSRVCGPDLFSAILKESKSNRYSHYFYGSTQKTINIIKNKMSLEYPELIVKGAVSPPFQPISEYDIDSLAKEINELKPTFFWCGLGAPKQEQLMALLQPKLDSTICIGVGLVFEYFAGTVERAPLWAQRNGLEWFYRIIQQPQKLNRIIKPFAWISIQLLKSKLHYK